MKLEKFVIFGIAFFALIVLASTSANALTIFDPVESSAGGGGGYSAPSAPVSPYSQGYLYGINSYYGYYPSYYSLGYYNPYYSFGYNYPYYGYGGYGSGYYNPYNYYSFTYSSPSFYASYANYGGIQSGAVAVTKSNWYLGASFTNTNTAPPAITTLVPVSAPAAIQTPNTLGTAYIDKLSMFSMGG